MEQGAGGLGVVQAATRLGISVDAVRKRIRRRTLRAYKVDGEWRIILDVPASTDQPNDQDAGQGRPASSVQDEGRITRLEGEVLFLRQLTEHQAGVIAQLSATVTDLTRRVPELPAGSSSPPPEPEPSDAVPHSGAETAEKGPSPAPWWKRWFGSR